MAASSPLTGLPSPPPLSKSSFKETLSIKDTLPSEPLIDIPRHERTKLNLIEGKSAQIGVLQRVLV